MSGLGRGWIGEVRSGGGVSEKWLVMVEINFHLPFPNLKAVLARWSDHTDRKRWSRFGCRCGRQQAVFMSFWTSEHGIGVRRQSRGFCTRLTGDHRVL